MAEPITVDNGALTDYAVLVDDVVDATLGTGAKQLVGLADATIGSTTKVAAGGGVEANALRVTLASDSTGVVSVDDNGSTLSIDDGAGSITVDGTVTNTPSGDHTVIGKAADGAAVSGNPVLMAGQDGTNVQSLKTDASGELQVDVLTLPALAAGTNNIGDVDVLTVPAPLSTTGGGTEATALRVTVANDSTGVVSVDDNGASLTVDVGTALPAGTNNIGDVDVLTLPALVAGTANIGDVDVLTLPALPAGTNNIGDVDVLSIAAGTNNIGRVVPIGATTDGLDIFRSLDLDETEEEVKATAGTLYGWYIANTATSTRFVKFYNATAATVVVGTTTPVMTLPIPGNSSDDVGANLLGGVGINFGTAITVAATTGVADADVGAPAVNDVVCNLFFK